MYYGKLPKFNAARKQFRKIMSKTLQYVYFNCSILHVECVTVNVYMAKLINRIHDCRFLMPFLECKTVVCFLSRLFTAHAKCCISFR